jgi:hypothetical protein
MNSPHTNCSGCGRKSRCLHTTDCPGVSANFARKAPLFDHGAVAEALLEPGFARFVPAIPESLKGACAEMANAFTQLALDPNDPNKARRRRYQKFIYIPWSKQLLVRPITYYQQAPGFNPQDGDRRRHFEGLGNLIENELLTRLTIELFDALPVDGDYVTTTWDVGVHLIRMEARPGVPAVASPNRLHKDGEPFTAIVLVQRENVAGGTTIIAADGNGDKVLAKFTLTESFETAIVRDAAVWHHVTPVEVAKNSGLGVRDVVLIEFSPMKSDLHEIKPSVKFVHTK